MILSRYIVRANRIETVDRSRVQVEPIRHRVLTLNVAGDEIAVTTNRGDHVMSMSVGELDHIARLVRRERRRSRLAAIFLRHR